LTIQHRPSMGEWSTLATLTTDALGACTYTWIPEAVGTYEIKASWPGDASTLPGESNIKTVTAVKASSALRISISPTTVDAGSDVTIQGSISPVRATVTVTVHYRPSGGNWSTLGTAITDAAGSYAYTWTPEAIGTYEIKTLWDGDAQTLADESDAMTLTVRVASSTLTITASPTTATIGDNVVLTGSISPVRVGATITIQYRPSGGNWDTLTTETTDTTGSYTFTWTPSTQGSYELEALWEEDATAQAAESSIVTLVVQSPPLIPMELLISLTGVAVAVIVVAVFLKRKTKRPEQSGEEPRQK